MTVHNDGLPDGSAPRGVGGGGGGRLGTVSTDPGDRGSLEEYNRSVNIVKGTHWTTPFQNSR